MGDYYVKAWTRCPPYIVGIGLGYVLHYTKKTTIKLNKVTTYTYLSKRKYCNNRYTYCFQLLVLLLWVVSLTTMFCVTYLQNTMEYLTTGTQPSELANALYNTFAKASWGLALSWLIFACRHGYGGKLTT